MKHMFEAFKRQLDKNEDEFVLTEQRGNVG